MLIRCEKCSTVYELDEKVLPPSGAPVQCSRCQFIFTAYPSAHNPTPASAPMPAPTPDPTSNAEPPRSSSSLFASPPARTPPPIRDQAAIGSSLAGAVQPGARPGLGGASPPSTSVQRPLPGPAGSASGANGVASLGAASAPSASAGSPSPPPPARKGSQGRATGPPGEAEPQRTADGRPIRKVQFPEEEPSTSSQRPLPKATALPSPGARSGGLLRWLVPLAIVVAAAAAVAAWRMVTRRATPEAVQRRSEGHSLLLRDDRVSLARAAIAFEDAARLSPSLFQANADHVLARALVLGHVRAEAERLALRASAAEREPAPMGPEDPARLSAQAEAARLRAEAEAARGRARQLEADAGGELAPLMREHPRDPAVLRADALLAAFAQEPARADQAVRRARAAGPRDAWIDMAEAAAGVSATTPERRAEGTARAEALARAHPEMLRARVLLALALGRAGRPDEAASALDAVLAANPAHEDARAVKAALAPLQPMPRAPDAAPGEAPAGTPALLPRKTLSHAAVEAEG